MVLNQSNLTELDKNISYSHIPYMSSDVLDFPQIMK